MKKRLTSVDLSTRSHVDAPADVANGWLTASVVTGISSAATLGVSMALSGPGQGNVGDGVAAVGLVATLGLLLTAAWREGRPKGAVTTASSALLERVLRGRDLGERVRVAATREGRPDVLEATSAVLVELDLLPAREAALLDGVDPLVALSPTRRAGRRWRAVLADADALLADLASMGAALTELERAREDAADALELDLPSPVSVGRLQAMGVTEALRAQAEGYRALSAEANAGSGSRAELIQAVPTSVVAPAPLVLARSVAQAAARLLRSS